MYHRGRSTLDTNVPARHLVDYDAEQVPGCLESAPPPLRLDRKAVQFKGTVPLEMSMA